MPREDREREREGEGEMDHSKPFGVLLKAIGGGRKWHAVVCYRRESTWRMLGMGASCNHPFGCAAASQMTHHWRTILLLQSLLMFIAYNLDIREYP